MEPTGDQRALTGEQYLSVTRVYIEKMTEFMLRDLDEDVSTFPTLNGVEQAYKQAYWRKRVDLAFGTFDQVSRTPANDEAKWALILEVYGHLFPDLPSTTMRPDVKSRAGLVQAKNCERV